jgi:FkbH-like protein
MLGLHWLPDALAFSSDLDKASRDAEWAGLVAVSKHRLDFIQTNKVDRVLTGVFGKSMPGGARPVKIAVLSSCTVEHLFPGIRVAALRRGMFAEICACDYGQYRQELSDPDSRLYAFKPDVTLFVFDTPHLLAGAQVGFDRATAQKFADSVVLPIRELWRRAKDAFGCQVVQQLLLPTQTALMGSNEHRLPGSPAAMIARTNGRLRELADEEGADVLDMSGPITRDGLAAWHDPVLWHRAKQEISPVASPGYGDYVARLISARLGLSAKCLVLDLDNTLWGGVIGDDGLEGIRLGQGDSEGEAFLSFQTYVRNLAQRGVILAVCSKNDEANALAPFEKHPEMVLRRSDISCFVANWNDKATNIRHIAQTLNIGLDSLVLVDDNPFERNIVRRELPMVTVPELPEDPALYADCIADAGYFESLQVTAEDRDRTAQYRANDERAALQANHTDMNGYLASLDMELRFRKFDTLGLKRITQLINKTNQFNLTTKRYTEQQVVEVIQNPRSLGFQFRLTDRFGDNGVIAITIARVEPEGETASVDTWLMSCRVLGRNVEEATLDALVDMLKPLGVKRLVGVYRPTEKNQMVRSHYEKLGFEPIRSEEDGSSAWTLDLSAYRPRGELVKLVQEDKDE